MKLTKQLFGFALTAIAAGALVGCTNDFKYTPNTGNVDLSVLSPVTKPDAIVWSGEQTFGNSFDGTRSSGYMADVYTVAGNKAVTSTRAEDLINGEEKGSWKYSEGEVIGWVPVETTVINRQAEHDYVDEQLPENQGNIQELENIDFDFLFFAKNGDLTFELYPVFSQTNTNPNNLGIFWYEDENTMKKQIVWENMNRYECAEIYNEPSKGIKIKVKKGYKFGFFWTGKYNNWHDGAINDDPNGYITFYSRSSLNEQLFVTTGGGEKVSPERKMTEHAGIFEGNGRMYLGLEDWTDFDFQDWVFTFDQILPTVNGDNPTPGKDDPSDEPDDDCELCGHPNHGRPGVDECDQCTNPGDGCYHEPTCPDCGHPNHGRPGVDECDQCTNPGDGCYHEPTCPDCGHPNHGRPGVDECDQCTNPGDGCYHEPACPDCGHPNHGDDYCPAPGCKDPNCTPQEEDKELCPKPGCNHPLEDHHDGVCEDCFFGQSECKPTPSPDAPENPDDPNNKYKYNEVEINLSMLDIHELANGSQKYDIADLVSKLSMHVRYPHDIEVIIPVPQSIYCDQDDLYILKDHYDTNGQPNWVYGGEKNELVYVIGGYVKDEDGKIVGNTSWKVTLGIEFVSVDDDHLTVKQNEVLDINGDPITSGGYIRVYTDGICKELIDFLMDYYGDGINFEVYNYYNRGTQYTTGKYAEISYETLQYNYLSHSFVNFDWNETGTKVLPNFYINAFNKVNLLPVKGDCYTWILGDERANNGVYLDNGTITGGNTTVTWGTNTQRSEYANPYQGVHLNGSDLNWIYTLKSIGGVDSDDMPKDTKWPFVISPWQYYRLGEGQTNFNWGN